MGRALLISKLVDELLQRSYSVLGGGQAGDFSGKSLGVAVGRGIGTNQRNTGAGGFAGMGVAELVGALGQAELRDTVGQRTEQRARTSCSLPSAATAAVKVLLRRCRTGGRWPANRCPAPQPDAVGAHR